MATIKIIWSFLSKLGLSVLALIAPIKICFVLIIMVMSLDMYLAIINVYKKKGWNGIKSEIASAGFFRKFFTYIVGLLVIFIVEKYILGFNFFKFGYALSKGLTMIIIMFEVKSIDERNVSMGKKSIITIIGEVFQYTKKGIDVVNNGKKDIEESIKDIKIGSEGDSDGVSEK